jgi:hypothetical protein
MTDLAEKALYKGRVALAVFLDIQGAFDTLSGAAMGLDLLPILPRPLLSGSAVAVVGQRVRPQQHCQNGRFFLLIQCL